MSGGLVVPPIAVLVGTALDRRVGRDEDDRTVVSDLLLAIRLGWVRGRSTLDDALDARWMPERPLRTIWSAWMSKSPAASVIRYALRSMVGLSWMRVCT
jgi:hypothetical protein